MFHSTPQTHLFTLAKIKLLINANAFSFPFPAPQAFPFPNYADSPLFVIIVFSYKYVCQTKHFIFSNKVDLSQF